MPIEIKELHIRGVGERARGRRRPERRHRRGGEDPAALVAECVEQVLQILRDQKER